MNVVDSVMRENGVKYLRLHTGSHVTPLIRFYYGRGFYTEEIETDRGYLRARLVKEYKEQT